MRKTILRAMKHFPISYLQQFAVLFFISILSLPQKSFGQSKEDHSLLWEITGNKLKKPSYLYGTMHVSNRVAFHLSDSFFKAIEGVETVALETNPNDWLHQMTYSELFKEIMSYNRLNVFSYASRVKDDPRFALKYPDMRSVAFMLASEPQLINDFLYRMEGGEGGNFEENTYLDLFIYQVAKKTGKHVIGLEDFPTMMRYLQEADRQANLNDEDDKLTEYLQAREEIDRNYSLYEMLQDAYRKGDLHKIDSFSKLANPSKAHQKYMLYLRNEMMVKSMDSIMQNQTVFAGVGAAHLPGSEGMIEMLRKMGYQVRPIKFAGRNEKKREKYDKIKISHPFKEYQTRDGFISFQIPGNFVEFPPVEGISRILCPDMANGVYYTIMRYATAHDVLNQSPEYMMKRVDSLLFENIPGKIQKKTAIKGSPYPAVEIINKTRKGDLQRYQIYVTPYEVIVVKLGGLDQFAKSPDAEKFFKSIKLGAYLNTSQATHFKEIGAKVNFPTNPWNPNVPDPDLGSVDNTKVWMSKATQGSSHYFLRCITETAPPMLDHDSFELFMIMRSFGKSEGMKLLNISYTQLNKRKLAEAKFLFENKDTVLARALIRGQHYYLWGVFRPDDNAKTFLQSFELTEYQQPNLIQQNDLFALYSFRGPEKARGALYNFMERWYGPADTLPITTSIDSRMRITSPMSGEIIWADHLQLGKYRFYKDSTEIWDEFSENSSLDSTCFIKKEKRITKNHFTFQDRYYTDTASTRGQWHRLFLADNRLYELIAIYDTIDGPTPFVNEVFNSFTPKDTIVGARWFTPKDSVYLADLTSRNDKKWRDRMLEVNFEGKVRPQFFKPLQELLDTFPMSKEDKNYYRYKMAKTGNPSLFPYFKTLYENAGDTADNEIQALRYMYRLNSSESRSFVKDRLLKNPPIPSNSYQLSQFFQELIDTPKTALFLFPEILKLWNMKEYRINILNYTIAMLDSQLIKPADLGDMTNTILTEARQHLKRFSATGSSQDFNNTREYRAMLRILSHLYEQNPDAKEIMLKTMNMVDKSFAVNTAELLLKKGILPEKEYLEKMASHKFSRVKLYRLMHQFKKEDDFPTAFASSDSLLASAAFILADTYNNLSDSLEKIGLFPTLYNGEQMEIHYYKVKSKYGERWNYLSVGPHQPGKFGVDKTFDQSSVGAWLKRDVPEDKMKELTEELIIKVRYADFIKKRDYED